jgi:tape measure domain-containing protein
MSDVTVRIGADASQLQSSLAGIDRRMQGFASGMVGKFTAIAGSIAAAFTGREIYGAGRDIIKMRAMLDSMEGPLGSVNNEMERLKDLAMMPGLTLESAVEGSVRLRAVGMSADDARETIAELSNAIGLVGGSTEDMNGVVLALGQIQSKGKVFAEEINQINERLPQVRVLMKQAFGTSNTEDLQKMGLSSEAFIKGITEQMKTLPRAADNANTSIKNLGDQLSQALGVIGAAALNEAAGGIKLLVDGLAELGSALDQMVNGDEKASDATKSTMLAHIAKAEAAMKEARSYEELIAAYKKLEQQNKNLNMFGNDMSAGDYKTVKDEIQKIAAEFSKLNSSGATDLEIKRRQLEDYIKKSAPAALKAVMAFVSPDTNANPFKAEEGKADATRFDLASNVSSLTRVGGDSGFRFSNITNMQLSTAQRTESEIKKQTPILKGIERKLSNKTTATFR